ncbi:MAG: tetraacyldisaccharide 4'-kinase [Desulfomonilia bacterium]|jgi:tetraacyldisaccharide 4'-kinase
MRKALSRIYGLVVAARNKLYDAGVLSVHRTGIPVVSIGNIEAGGTGKTPTTIALARELAARGYRPAIVTRGYRGRLKGVVRVSPSHRPGDVGDEALLMARATGLPVIKSPDRVKGALLARDTLDCDLVLLDDGFQHRRIHRDLDIVLISGDPASDELLPLGRLREPAGSLQRADIVIRTKGAGSGVLSAELVPCSLVDIRGRREDLLVLEGKNVLAVSGIARPGHFTRMLEGLGARVEAMCFADHHEFTGRDLEAIGKRASGKDLIVTTEKDLVRIDAPPLEEKWRALKVEMRIEGIQQIIGEIERIVEESRISRS